MAQVYIVQGVCAMTPGAPMYAAATKETAETRARALVDTLLRTRRLDGLKPDESRHDALRRVRAHDVKRGYDDDASDVWITPLELEP